MVGTPFIIQPCYYENHECNFYFAKFMLHLKVVPNAIWVLFLGFLRENYTNAVICSELPLSNVEYFDQYREF